MQRNAIVMIGMVVHTIYTRWRCFHTTTTTKKKKKTKTKKKKKKVTGMSEVI